MIYKKVKGTKAGEKDLRSDNKYLYQNVGKGDWESSNHKLPTLLPWRCNSIHSEEMNKAQWGYQVANSAFFWCEHTAELTPA